ncbi:MAG: DUF393 domain-containing protein [Pirellulales bacterium]
MQSSNHLPPKILVLFDGQCNFCRTQIGWLQWLDKWSQLEFLSLHDPSVAARAPNLTFEQLMEQMWVVTPEGSQFGGADAVRYLSRKLPFLFPLAPVLHFPFSMPLWRACYRCIARYRYYLAGKNCENGTCSLHFHHHGSETRPQSTSNSQHSK